MAIHIIIDGYNLLHQSIYYQMQSTGANIETGRQILINFLSDYKKRRGHKITVVFDGNADFAMYGGTEYIKGIEVMFSYMENADSVIKRIACKEKERAVVVTSDREIASYVSSIGSTAVSSEEFERKINKALMYKDSEDTYSKKYSKEPEHLPWQPSTKKKGPSRKLSKKDRKKKLKLQKL